MRTRNANAILEFTNSPPPQPNPFSPTFTMKRNIVIFLIILILFILIGAIAYALYYLQTRMSVANGTSSSVSEMTEDV
ncbi:hypothetical protein EJ05DRAFT_503180 [Pseudovirgaria hyperparasitica]|uniref:Uncharacterized protein n=1 Tax=Pseudovirgaria hyperparasitica TaxID=470096 RepID=A0A6A6W2B0_9PEZI|nr:uncharacterized protein EJ05DRAFT_503180 [Pseudovirgaria hyperparasitica]KAF2755727.1 hypothetical protein EJ05DRAFT_503180 [Pseudovirgaria hyperparasitica]